MSMPQANNDITDANRITRCCLIGTGIISGMELSLNAHFHICVSAGKGITSDGKYIELPLCKVFTFYRPFEVALSYDFFKTSDGKNIDLWELVEDSDFRNNDQPLNPQYNQEKLNPFLKDKVVLMFAETQKIEMDPDYLNEDFAGDSALSAPKLHVLLIRQSDLLKQMDISRISTQLLWKRQKDDEDYIYSDVYNPEDERIKAEDVNRALNPALRLPILSLRRFGFANGDPYDCPPGGPDTSVYPHIKGIDDIVEAYRPAIDEAIHQLDKALRSTFKYYGSIIDKYPNWDIKNSLDALNDKWESYKTLNTDEDPTVQHKEYIQYFYDWMRDLLAAYHELRLLLIDYTYLSLANAGDFSNHFLLGQPLKDTAGNVPRPLRHHFKQPPIFNGQARRLEKIKLYGWRILVMIKNFYLPGFIQETKLDFCNTPIETEQEILFDNIKITPGNYYDKSLGQQSIPYYYFPVARHRYSTHHFWNYELSKNSNADHNLSYHANDGEDSYTNHLQVIRPLHYNIDHFPFYRIEGFIGQKIRGQLVGKKGLATFFRKQGVLSELKLLIKKYNLNFDVIAVEASSNQPLTLQAVASIKQSSFNHFMPNLIGMEHIGGVLGGGTFILVHDENGKIIADFSLPYRCCLEEKEVIGEGVDDKDENGDEELRRERIKEELLKDIGKADPDTTDKLERINGIGPETKEVMHLYGIYTFLQLSKMSEKWFDLIRITNHRRLKWMEEAKAFHKKING